MKIKRQKLYKDRESILKDIATSTRRMVKLRNKAAAEDEFADMLFEAENPEGENHREEAKRLRAQAGRIESTRLPKLRNALAAIDTEPLGLVGAEQRQVVLEKLT